MKVSLTNSHTPKEKERKDRSKLKEDGRKNGGRRKILETSLDHLGN